MNSAFKIIKDGKFLVEFLEVLIVHEDYKKIIKSYFLPLSNGENLKYEI